MGLRFALLAGGIGLLASACTLLFTPFLQLRVKSFQELALEKDVSIRAKECLNDLEDRDPMHHKGKSNIYKR